MTKGRVCILLSNHGKMGDRSTKTGWYLPEAAHPYHVFKEAGWEITVASPKGGPAPLDPSSYDAFYNTDKVSKSFFDDFCGRDGDDMFYEHTERLTHLSPGNFDVAVCAGGHGPMFDFSYFPEGHKYCHDDVVNPFIRDVYENGGIVAAVCHGPAGIAFTKLSNGEYLVKGKKVTCFTNAEEEAIDLVGPMPFLLEDKLKEHGACFEAAQNNWEEKVCADQRVVTGQNPASAGPMASKIVDLFNEMHAKKSAGSLKH